MQKLFQLYLLFLLYCYDYFQKTYIFLKFLNIFFNILKKFFLNIFNLF